MCKVLKFMDPSDLEAEGRLNLKIGNPCENHPSDHYSLVYEILLQSEVKRKFDGSYDMKPETLQDILGDFKRKLEGKQRENDSKQ